MARDKGLQGEIPEAGFFDEASYPVGAAPSSQADGGQPTISVAIPPSSDASSSLGLRAGSPVLDSDFQQPAARTGASPTGLSSARRLSARTSSRNARAAARLSVALNSSSGRLTSPTEPSAPISIVDTSDVSAPGPSPPAALDASTSTSNDSGEAKSARAGDSTASSGSSLDRESSLQTKLEAGEPVFTMENVAVHPSALASQRIRGRLRLVKAETAVYLSWTPYTPAERPHAAEAQAQGPKYAIRAVMLSEIRSIRRQTPPLGWNYVIIVLNTGLAFPPLYFYDGGVRSFISAVRQHATLIKSHDDPNVYLVNDPEDPLMVQRSLSSLRRGAFPDMDSALQAVDGSARQYGSAGASSTRAANEAAKDVPMQVLQGFAGLTQLARNALGVSRRRHGGDRILGGDDAEERMPVRDDGRGRAGAKGAQPESAPSELGGNFEIVDPLEKELAATKAPSQVGPPVTHEEWVSCLDEEGRVSDPEAIRYEVFKRGLEPELRREVWKFLLGYYPWNSTYAERRALDEAKREEYFIYKRQWESVTEAQAKRFAKYRERVSRIEKDVVRTDRKLPQFAEDDSPACAVLRSILLTYSFYNFDLGYCQGMSDLVAPFLVLMEDECEAFWCFAQFMETMGRNFNRDQTGMQNQLLAVSKLMRLLDPPLFQYLESIDAANFFCCFRWLLILFKREFEFEDVLKLWERCWTCPTTKGFHLYVCCAILKRVRRNIFDEQMQFDHLLRFINELSGRVDLDDVLQYAEALCLWAGKRGEQCIPEPVEEEMVLIEGPERDES